MRQVHPVISPTNISKNIQYYVCTAPIMLHTIVVKFKVDYYLYMQCTTVRAIAFAIVQYASNKQSLFRSSIEKLYQTLPALFINVCLYIHMYVYVGTYWCSFCVYMHSGKHKFLHCIVYRLSISDMYFSPTRMCCL